MALLPLIPLYRAVFMGEAIGPFNQIRQMAPWNGPKPVQPWDVLQIDGVLQFYTWRDLVFDAWGRRFFKEASVSIPPGSKVGLVGRNGIGKSTLFKLITGELVPLGGEILLPKRDRIGSVDQEHPATPIRLLDTVLAADVERAQLMADLETAEPEEQVGPPIWKEALGAVARVLFGARTR